MALQSGYTVHESPIVDLRLRGNEMTAHTDEAAEHPFADLPYRRGQRVRITYEAEIIEATVASAKRGTARVITRSGAGMNDSVWLVREPGYGEVISVEIVSEGD